MSLDPRIAAIGIVVWGIATYFKSKEITRQDTVRYFNVKSRILKYKREDDTVKLKKQISNKKTW